MTRTHNETSLPDQPLESVWLDSHDPFLRAQALEGLRSGDVVQFLRSASSGACLPLVSRNIPVLCQRGLYEKALIHALVKDDARWSLATLEWMISLGDPVKLRAAGDPLPGTAPFVVYRGVAGTGRARRTRGLHWTASIDQACWFAFRFHGQDPAVFRTELTEPEVVAYCNDRREQDFVALLADSNRPKRVDMSNDELKQRAEAESRAHDWSSSAPERT